MNKRIFRPADILIPSDADMSKWSVVACDQFSSEREYWERVKVTVADAPSTLNLIIPETYLEDGPTTERAEQINVTMGDYLDSGIFKVLSDSYIYLERKLSDGSVRRGLVGAVDLESYDYTPGTRAPIRASENTIVARLPARVEVRRGAKIELPHIMALINDKDLTVIEPNGVKTGALEPVYDFEMMEHGGHIKGWRVTGKDAQDIETALSALGEQSDVQVIIGDGNHSLAAAKSFWDEIKADVPEAERASHPSRFALLELNNVYDPAIQFEAIHRVVFDTNPGELLEAFKAVIPASGAEVYTITAITASGDEVISIPADSIGELIGILQVFLDKYAQSTGCTVDYIHGDDSTRTLSNENGRVGFILPSMGKSDFFATVTAGGVFPKKSFSIGHACDKRYYLECREIRK